MFQLLETPTKSAESPAPGCSHYSERAGLPAELPWARAAQAENAGRAGPDLVSPSTPYLRYPWWVYPRHTPKHHVGCLKAPRIKTV